MSMPPKRSALHMHRPLSSTKKKEYMKTVFKFLIIIFSINTASAECNQGFNFYPKNPSVHRNTKIIIEAYGSKKYFAILRELDNKYPIYLVSKNRRIKLIKEILIEGRYGLHQAIFKLDKLLVGGESYEIEVQNLREEEKRQFEGFMTKYKNGKYEKNKLAFKKFS